MWQGSKLLHRITGVFSEQKAGLQSEFERDNITVFAASSSAWNELPSGVMDYLQSDEVPPFCLHLHLQRFFAFNETFVAKLQL